MWLLKYTYQHSMPIYYRVKITIPPQPFRVAVIFGFVYWSSWWICIIHFIEVDRPLTHCLFVLSVDWLPDFRMRGWYLFYVLFYLMCVIFSWILKMSLNRSAGSVVRAFAPCAGGRGFDPRPRHTKDVLKMVPDASLLSAQHIRTGLASLSS